MKHSFGLFWGSWLPCLAFALPVAAESDQHLTQPDSIDDSVSLALATLPSAPQPTTPDIEQAISDSRLPLTPVFQLEAEEFLSPPSPRSSLNQITAVSQLAAAEELATLQGRVSNLEARTGQLEAQQFSKTTRLVGEGIVMFADAYGGQAGERTQPLIQYRTLLSLVSSFTGKDMLILGMRTGNTPRSSFGFAVPGTAVTPFKINISSAEGTLASQFGAFLNNQFSLTTMEYQFPVGKRLRFYVATNNEVFNQFTDTLNPYFEDNDRGRGSVSAFGQRNPIYRLGGGPGAAVKFQATKQLTLTGGYLTPFILGGGDPEFGFIRSGYSTIAQVTWRPLKSLGVSATYINSYAEPGRFGFNNLSLNMTGTAVANTLAGQTSIVDALRLLPTRGPEVAANAYGLQFSYQPNPRFVVNGWFGATYARIIGKGDGEIFTYALNFGFPDLGKRGNLLGFTVGAEPYLHRFMGGNPQPFRVDIPWHLQGFYRWQINPNISLTPGLIWLLAPNQDNRNPDSVIAIMRTTFNF